MNLADRLKVVGRMKLCYNCLKGIHFLNSCRKPKVCTVSDCNVKHYLLLHNWVKPESDHTATHLSVNCAATDSSFVRYCLGIIPVLVRGGDGNSCQTYALLDDGADKTLCDERLLDKLNLTSRPVTFHMSTASSSGSTIHGQEVDLQVRSIDGNENVSLQKVWSRSRSRSAPAFPGKAVRTQGGERRARSPTKNVKRRSSSTKKVAAQKRKRSRSPKKRGPLERREYAKKTMAFGQSYRG
ncbi:unnamed protein product [Mytilus coruscus]|uniref:Peptidase A2 domain-containing protein n=1 Tax=Mytilus coruscus TaxID=42192 RepID=A0A6J8EYC6_MYTCO|nr:unnamed protein product [Mytilus coruscus]